MAAMSARELRILRLLSGFEDGTEHSVADLSRRFGVPAERIRELAASGLAKLDEQHGGPEGDCRSR